MESLIKKYLYIGTSFTSFKFDELSLLAIKYYLSKLKITKYYYFRKINNLCYKKKKYHPFVNYEKIYIKYVISSLKNSSFLLSNNEKEIKLYTKVKKNNIHVENKFDISYLNYQDISEETCLILYSKKDLKSVSYLTSFLDKIKIIYLEEIIDDEFSNELIFDRIKLRLLQGEHEIYFLHLEGYDNFIANFLFDINKIAIHV